MKQFKRVFVTGAASGIGLRLAELAFAEGADIAAFDRDPSGLATLQEAAGEHSRRVAVFPVDVRGSEAVAAAVDQAVAEIGPPDLAINSAGIQLAKPFDSLSAEEFTRVIEVNLIGSRNFAAAALPHMGSGSRLALISSLAGLVPNYSYAAYSSSKYGIIGLAEVLRLEYQPRGIGVSVICPPEVETNLVYEERRTMHPVSAALKRTAGTLDVDTAARQILAGLEREQFLIVPSGRAKAVVWMSRYVPSKLTRAGVDLAVRRALSRS